eukprot:UN04301
MAVKCVNHPKKKDKTDDRQRWKQKVQKKKKKRKNARPATLGAVDLSQMYHERSSTKKKDDDYYRKMKAELKKQGPRDIGKIKYAGIKTRKRKPKLKKKLSMNDIDHDSLPILQPKLGPREIGKIKYKGLKLSKKDRQHLQNSNFLNDNLSHSTRKLKRLHSGNKDLFGVKLGPQEIS